MTGPNISFVDSNILVYAFDDDAHSKQPRSVDVLTRLVEAHNGVISLQVLGEFFNATTRRIASPLTQATAALEVERLSRSWPVVEPSLFTVLAATRLAVRFQLSYWDGLIVATAVEAGASRVLTEDMQNGQVINGVRILNPLDPDFDLSQLD